VDRTTKIILFVIGAFFFVVFLWLVVAAGLIGSFSGPPLPEGGTYRRLGIG
jgi:hypothetical protein